MLICRKRASRCPIFLLRRMPVPNNGSHSTFSSNAISVPGSRQTATCGAPAAAKPRVIEFGEFGRHQLVLDPGRPGRDMVQTIVNHRMDSFSCEKPDGCPPQQAAAGCHLRMLSRLSSNVAV